MKMRNPTSVITATIFILFLAHLSSAQSYVNRFPDAILANPNRYFQMDLSDYAYPSDIAYPNSTLSYKVDDFVVPTKSLIDSQTSSLSNA